MRLTWIYLLTSNVNWIYLLTSNVSWIYLLTSNASWIYLLTSNVSWICLLTSNVSWVYLLTSNVSTSAMYIIGTTNCTFSVKQSIKTHKDIQLWRIKYLTRSIFYGGFKNNCTILGQCMLASIGSFLITWKMTSVVMPQTSNSQFSNIRSTFNLHRRILINLKVTRIVTISKKPE